MSLVGLPPGFIPPLVVAPAASAAVPVIAGAVATGVALPSLPLVGAVAVGAAAAGLAAVAVAAAVNEGAQIWGLLNNAAPSEGIYGPFAGQNGQYIPPQPDAVGSLRVRVSVQYPSDPTPWVYGGVVGPVSRGASIYEAPQENGPNHLRYRTQTADGTVFDDCIQGSSGACIGLDGYATVLIDVLMPDGTTTEPGLLPWPEPVRPRPPAVHPAAAPVPVVLPGGLPAPAPQAPPEAEPLTQPGPAPATPATPATSPAPAVPVPAPPAPTPFVLPAAVPGTTTPTTPDGHVQPAPLPPPAQTPPTVHVINGTPIPANGPQPTPQGIAQELGRIENKLAALLDPDPRGGPDLTDRLGLILSAIQAIAEIISSASASGEYRISSPCVLGEDGQRIERVVGFDGALNAFGVLRNRIDALAQLLQEHKDLKQPICRETPATGGQAVTVNFVQVD